MPKLHTLVAITAATLIHAGTPAAAVPVTYTDEASFNAALAALGASARHEGFEDDAVFGGIRAGVKAKQISSGGVIWSSNDPANSITTSAGAANSGSWGLYSTPHGTYASFFGCDVAGACADGVILTGSSGRLIAVGGYVSGTAGAAIALVLDGNRANPLSFGLQLSPTAHVFVGVIDTDGFSSLEFRESEGTLDDQKSIFLDDVTYSFAPEPGVFALLCLATFVAALRRRESIRWSTRSVALTMLGPIRRGAAHACAWQEASSSPGRESVGLQPGRRCCIGEPAHAERQGRRLRVGSPAWGSPSRRTQ
jgi:hypothetical protein